MKPNLVNGEASKGTATTAGRANVADALRALSARSPQESLGLTDESGLPRAFLQALIGCVIIFAGLTFGPYFYEKQFPAHAKEATQPAPTQGPEVIPVPPAVAQSRPDANAKKPDGTKEPGKKLEKKDVPDLLGETGVKKGNPKIDVDPFTELFKENKKK